MGLAGHPSLWIPNFALLVQPLYQATRGDLSEPLELKSNICSAFNTLKQAILSAPALTLPDLSPHLILYVTERHKIALGVLGQNQGPSFTPVTYLSKQLDAAIQGWPACLYVLWQQLHSSLREVKNLLLEHPLSFVHHMTLRTYFLTNP